MNGWGLEKVKRIILKLILVADAVLIIALLVGIGQRIFFTPEPSQEEISSGVVTPKETSVFQEVTSSVPPQAPTPIVKRNILFQYRDSRPKKVEIAGDFNNWVPTEMTKRPNHTWTIIYQLEPGEYTYKFLVDGKLKKDPYNPRSAPDGYGGESSLLIVKPLNADIRR